MGLEGFTVSALCEERILQVRDIGTADAFFREGQWDFVPHYRSFCQCVTVQIPLLAPLDPHTNQGLNDSSISDARTTDTTHTSNHDVNRRFKYRCPRQTERR